MGNDWSMAPISAVLAYASGAPNADRVFKHMGEHAIFSYTIVHIQQDDIRSELLGQARRARSPDRLNLDLKFVIANQDVSGCNPTLAQEESRRNYTFCATPEAVDAENPKPVALSVSIALAERFVRGYGAQIILTVPLTGEVSQKLQRTKPNQ